MKQIRKKIIWIVVGTSLPVLLLLFVLIAAAMAVSLVSIGSKQETEKSKTVHFQQRIFNRVRPGNGGTDSLFLLLYL